MSADYDRMDTHELEAFAAGYLEAIADQNAELERLRAEISRLDQEAQEAHADADAAYQQAFNGQAGRAAAARAVRDMEIMRARRARIDEKGNIDHD